MNHPACIRRSITRYRRYGWGASLLVHGVLVIGLLAWSFEPWWLAAEAWRQQRAIEVTIAETATASEAADEGPAEVRIVSDPADVTGQMVRDRVGEVVAESATMNEADKLARLDTLSQRLNQVTDEASINSLAGAMHSFLGTKPRATAPAKETPSGAFDFDTAQFHDIQRYPKEDGGFRYVTVLLDAQGRTVEVEVSQQEGEPVFLTMQRIKANPLLEQVYRQIVMPLMDQLVAAAKQADETAVREEPASTAAGPSTAPAPSP